MSPDTTPLLHHAPNTRSTAVLLLLEELRVPYRLNILNLKKGQQHEPAYRAINPMGKVPALQHEGAVITEQGAIFTYLADRFPGAGLAPVFNSPLRGPYLRWMFFYGNCLEPALIDRYLKREPGPVGTMPYGDFDRLYQTLCQQLAAGPYLLGAEFSAVDLLWGMALTWITGFGLLPRETPIAEYLDRLQARPLVAKVTAIDAELAAAQNE